MFFHENVHFFGDLEIVEVFDYFDKPLFVVLKNHLDHLFLAKIGDETESEEIWIYIEISNLRLSQVKTGALSIYEAFRLAESGEAYIITLPFSSSEPIINRIIPLEIPSEYLPPSDDKLLISTPTAPYLGDISSIAKQLNRVILRLRLHFKESLRTEAPAKLLGNVLVNAQGTINTIGQALKENFASRGKIPESITTNNEIRVRAFAGAGSFEIEFVSANLPNLLGETDVDEAINELVSIVKIGDDSEHLKEKMIGLKTRVASNYYKFLESISDEIERTDLNWALPTTGFVDHSVITAETARKAMVIIELGLDEPPNIIEVTGELVGLNIRSRQFEISTRERAFKGSFDKDLTNIMRGVAVGVIYKATLIQTITHGLTTGETEEKFSLQNLAPPS